MQMFDGTSLIAGVGCTAQSHGHDARRAPVSPRPPSFSDGRATGRNGPSRTRLAGKPLSTHPHPIRLVEALEDQLDQYPLASVIRSHAELIEQRLEDWSDHLCELGGPGRRYWDHPAELMYEEVGVLLGAMFVLLQAGITETVSIVMSIHRLHNQTIGKDAVMDMVPQLHAPTGLSFPKIANAAANFYKHRYEWPADWVAPATSQQGRTINLVRSIGMAPSKDLADNLLSAVHVVMAPSDGGLPDFSRRIVEDWRTRLAAHLRTNFNLPN